MPFTIPNVADAGFPDQAMVDKVDLDILAAGHAGSGVVSGCAVTSTGTGNGSTTVAAGTVRVVETLATVTSGALVHAANSSGNPRYDLVTVNNAGTKAVTQGSAAASPVFPAIPADSVVLAAVRIPNGHTTSSTIAANTITDKRVTVPAVLATNALADYHIQMRDPGKSGLLISGVDDPGALLKPILNVEDKDGAPIAWVSPAGGALVGTDNIMTAYTVFGPYKSWADVYGFEKQGDLMRFAFDGPPGNMLQWQDACHEVYQFTRLPTLGNWGVVGGCTTATFDFGSPPTGSPTTYRSGIRITHTSGTAWVATPGGATAYEGVTAGETVSACFNIRSFNAASARNANVRLSWWTSSGTQVGADINGPTVSVPAGSPGAFVTAKLEAQIVPTTATRFQMHILLVSSGTEQHDVAGCAVLRDQPLAVFAPPFVAHNTTTQQEALLEDGAVAGDRWLRTDTPNVPGQREYVCVNTGVPRLQKWQPMDSAPILRVQADRTNSTVTLADITDLSFTVAASGAYTFDYALMITSAALTTGWTFGFTGPSAPTTFSATQEYQSSATAWTTSTIGSFTNFTTVLSAYAITPTIIHVRIRGQLVNGANAGTVNLRFASEVAASAIVVKRGSLLSVM